MSRLRTTRREALLVIRAQLGDRLAFEALLGLTKQWLAEYLARLLGDRHRADDVAQEVLLIIWRTLRHVLEPKAYRAWVYRIATRQAFRSIRQRSRRERMEHALDPDPLASDPTPDPAELDRLLEEIGSLSPNSRTVVVLHYLEGLSIRHVAVVLGVPEGTVKSRLAYALVRLRGLAGDDRP